MKKNNRFFKSFTIFMVLFIAMGNAQAQSFEDKTIDAPASALPLSLINFSASKYNNDIIVNWKTVSEINNSYFVIERATDGINFVNMGQIVGRGNTTIINAYSFLDANTPILNLYYRLKQIDQNGNANYSSIIFVKANKTNNATISIYPNPIVQYKAIINISNMPTDKYNLVVKSLDGKLVYLNNQNLIAANTLFYLQLPATLKAGMYLIQITNANKLINITQKIILK